MNVLTVNCGTSTVKLALVAVSAGKSQVVRSSVHERAREQPSGRIRSFVADCEPAIVEAVGHRVVHGGTHTASVLIDEQVLASIDAARRYAPLHNSLSLEAIAEAREALGPVPMVAVFDTAFHASMPEVAAQYALPHEVASRHAVRRYGYHGIAHRSMSERYAELANQGADSVQVVTLQLGSGCSAAAVRGRGSVDTSMGFSPLEGLVMGTRPGDVDAGLILYLLRHGVSADELDDLLNRRAGLLGVSGRSEDMRVVLAEEARGDERARLAVDMFCYRLQKYIAAYLAVLDRPQAVIFGGGIGEHQPEIRRRVCEPLRRFGLELDPARNVAVTRGEGRISSDGSALACYVIPSDEERVIARDTFTIVSTEHGKRADGRG